MSEAEFRTNCQAQCCTAPPDQDFPGTAGGIPLTSAIDVESFESTNFAPVSSSQSHARRSIDWNEWMPRELETRGVKLVRRTKGLDVRALGLRRGEDEHLEGGKLKGH